jgi:hypothetical protein
VRAASLVISRKGQGMGSLWAAPFRHPLRLHHRARIVPPGHQQPVSTSVPFEGVIRGHFAVFRGLPRRRGIARETPENLESVSGGPKGLRSAGHSLWPCP